jgi:hypothetical protein
MFVDYRANERWLACDVEVIRPALHARGDERATGLLEGPGERQHHTGAGRYRLEACGVIGRTQDYRDLTRDVWICALDLLADGSEL